MNKRDLILSLLDSNTQPNTIPAAFFLHFDSAYHLGQAAIDKHLEYFRYTEMDFVKIQLELPFPAQPQIQKPEDWKTRLPFFEIDHYEPMLKVVEGLVKAAKKEALVILTALQNLCKSVHSRLLFGSCFTERCLKPGLTCSPQA